MAKHLVKSEALYQRALKSMPGGVHSNSRAGTPYPVYFQRGEGAYLFDVDGNRNIDLGMGNGAVIFGHDYAPFRELFDEKSQPGLLAGVETELSVEVAEKFLDFVPADQVRFTNTGTEAIMHSIHMARVYTEKNDVAVMEGAYNGWYDPVFVSSWPNIKQAGSEDHPHPLPGMGGLDENTLQSTVVLPFNNIPATERLIRANADRLAAIILEPVMIDVGYIPAECDYLERLRELCDELNILLIFDELLTGFRVDLGGSQTYYKVKPDLSTFGKAIGNGHMLAAVAGKKDVLETSAPGGKTNFIGTYNGHQTSLAAAFAVFELLKDKSIHQKLVERTEYVLSEFKKSATKYGVPAQMKGRGGHIHWYFSGEEVRDYRDAFYSDAESYIAFSKEMVNQGILVSGKYLHHHALSYCHDEQVIEKIVDSMDHALSRVAAATNLRV